MFSQSAPNPLFAGSYDAPPPNIAVSGDGGGIGVGGAVFLFLILLFTAAVVTIMVKFRSAWAWIRGLASGIMAGVFKSVEMAKKILKKIGCGILAAMAANPIGAILYATLRKRCQNKEVPFLEFVKKSYELVQKQYENTRVEGKNLSPEAMAHNAKLEAFLSTYKKQWPKDFDTFKDKYTITSTATRRRTERP
eukprot:jgi/Mesvir1/15106/Mv14746-RA.1